MMIFSALLTALIDTTTSKTNHAMLIFIFPYSWDYLSYLIIGICFGSRRGWIRNSKNSCFVKLIHIDFWDELWKYNPWISTLDFFVWTIESTLLFDNCYTCCLKTFVEYIFKRCLVPYMYLSWKCIRSVYAVACKGIQRYQNVMENTQ